MLATVPRSSVTVLCWRSRKQRLRSLIKEIVAGVGVGGVAHISAWTVNEGGVRSNIIWRCYYINVHKSCKREQQ